MDNTKVYLWGSNKTRLRGLRVIDCSLLHRIFVTSKQRSAYMEQQVLWGTIDESTKQTNFRRSKFRQQSTVYWWGVFKILGPILSYGTFFARSLTYTPVLSKLELPLAIEVSKAQEFDSNPQQADCKSCSACTEQVYMEVTFRASVHNTGFCTAWFHIMSPKFAAVIVELAAFGGQVLDWRY